MKKWFCLLMILLLPTGAVAEEELYPAQGENGLMGYINAEAEWIIEPQFDGAGSFRGDYALAYMLPEGADPEEWYDLDCEGVIDRSGEWVLPPEYCLLGGQSGSSFGGEDDGIWLVTQYNREDALEGFFDIPTGTFSGLKWYAVWPWCSDSRLIAVEDAETYLAGYADRSIGELVIPCVYYSVDPANFHDGIATVALSDLDGMEIGPWHLINEQGETIPLPEGYQSDYANDFSCGRIAVVSPEGLWGYADREGNIVIPAQFSEAYQFDEEGYAAVKFQEGDMGFINTDGHVLTRNFTWVSGYFWNGYAEVWLSDTNATDKVTAWIDTNGEIVSFMDSERFYPISEDRIWMRTAKEYSAPWHLLDGEGNVLTSEAYILSGMESCAFDEGLQAVRNSEGKWGYIDLNGVETIPFIYDGAAAFDGALAWVRLGEWEGYIDQMGNEVYMWTDATE